MSIICTNSHGNAHEWFYSLFLGTITSWYVLETSFVEKYIPRVHSYALSDAFNVVSHPPSLISTQDNGVSDLEEKSNQRMKKKFNAHIAKNENKDSNFQIKILASHILHMRIFQEHKFENEIDESPPNEQQDFSQHVENVATTLQWPHIDVENPQEHWQQEELVE
jgi:hypothetical protein